MDKIEEGRVEVRGEERSGEKGASQVRREVRGEERG